MRVLGIESSCDETAASVVRDGTHVLSNVIASQHDLHAEYAGVVPEIASRAHVEKILPVIRDALREAGTTLEEIDAIAVGNRPGLIGALLVGVSAAKALAWSLGKPLVGVDHVSAHLYAPLLTLDDAPQVTPDTLYPALGLVVSGGHTSMYRCDSPTQLRRLGSTIDDAVGECYDKVATILGLPHPGGPKVDCLALTGNDRAYDFPISRLDPHSLDFSFSGLKTAVLYAVRGVPQLPGRPLTQDEQRARQPLDLTRPGALEDVCASMQRAAVTAIVLKIERALDAWQGSPPTALLVGGGVSANSRLRSELTTLGERRGLRVMLPAMEFCLDNAAMVAGLGHARLLAGEADDLHLAASPSGSRFQ